MMQGMKNRLFMSILHWFYKILFMNVFSLSPQLIYQFTMTTSLKLEATHDWTSICILFRFQLIHLSNN